MVLILLQFINGGELEELLLDYSIHLDWSTRLYLAKDVAEGMRYLHKQGVIHRDLTSKVRYKNFTNFLIVFLLYSSLLRFLRLFIVF